jgi:FSR family fosmidomycin resistance protein-like MFS transporter
VSSLLLAVKNRALLVLMLGHFTNDTFAGVLAILYPILKLRFNLSNAEIGFATLAYTSASSLTQPFFGHLSDNHTRRWYAPLAIIWGACFVSLYGVVPTFPLLLLCATMAGIASGAYHPLGATNAAAVTDPGERNGALSLYTVAGTFRLRPWPLADRRPCFPRRSAGDRPIRRSRRRRRDPLLKQMGMVETVRRARAALTADAVRARPAWGPLGKTIGVTMLRSWVFLSVLQFTPIWYDELGFGPGFYGPLTTAIILVGAVGTLVGGNLADRIGQKAVVVWSLAATIPALLVYAAFPGPHALLTGAIFGLFCDASLSVTLVMAQNMVPGRVGVATGVILGLGFVTGGIGVPVTGRIADAVGIPAALGSLALLVVLAIALAATIPNDIALSRRMALPEPGGATDDSAPEAAPSGARSS